jgi:hypothetical protein
MVLQEWKAMLTRFCPVLLALLITLEVGNGSAAEEPMPFELPSATSESLPGFAPDVVVQQAIELRSDMTAENLESIRSLLTPGMGQIHWDGDRRRLVVTDRSSAVEAIVETVAELEAAPSSPTLRVEGPTTTSLPATVETTTATAATSLTVTIPESNRTIPDECVICAENLERIGQALSRYHEQHGAFPDWLSDLVPDYLAAETLRCPADSGTISPLPPDPRIDCSYAYQYPPVDDPMMGRTYRDWTSYQRSIYGNVVPVVRCGHHDKYLNLAWSGEVYFSGGLWESVFATQVGDRAKSPREEGGPTVTASDPEKYAKDFAAFVEEMNRTYPFFEMKGIWDDWKQTSERLAEEAKTCESDSEFLGIVIEAIECLRDGHMGFREVNADWPEPEPMYCPSVAFMPATENRVVLMYVRPGIDPDLKAGTIVTKIDGRDARDLLEERGKAAWEAGGHFSSPQRARFFEYRIPLCGDRQGATHTMTCRIGDEERTIELIADAQPGGWMHNYNQPDGLTRVGRSAFHAKLPGDIGYIYLRRVDASAPSGIRSAREAMPEAKGWIVDLCGNTGGGYDEELRNEVWKLREKPVACLIDAGCVSAGETLARDFVNLAGARLFGQRSAGSSSSKRGWKFPSGIATLTLSTRTRGGVGGKPIEYHGIDPDEEVEAVPEEVQAGKNSAIVRAEEWIAEQLKPARRTPQNRDDQT